MFWIVSFVGGGEPGFPSDLKVGTFHEPSASTQCFWTCAPHEGTDSYPPGPVSKDKESTGRLSADTGSVGSVRG